MKFNKGFTLIPCLMFLLNIESCGNKEKQDTKAAVSRSIEENKNLTAEDIRLLEETFSNISEDEKLTFIKAMKKSEIEQCSKISEYCKANGISISSKRFLNISSLIPGAAGGFLDKLPIPVKLILGYLVTAATLISTTGGTAAFVLVPLGIVLAVYIIVNYWDDIKAIVAKIRGALSSSNTNNLNAAITDKVLAVLSQAEIIKSISSTIPENIKKGEFQVDIDKFMASAGKMLDGWKLDYNTTGNVNWTLSHDDEMVAALDKNGKIITDKI